MTDERDGDADGHDEEGDDRDAGTDPLAWETTATRVDYECPGFVVRRDEVRFPDGRRDEYHYVDEPPAVVVLPFTPAGDVVVIEEWRQAVGRVNRGLPAGTMEPGEDVETAARRELAEETGYEAGRVERLTTVEPANGVANSVHNVVVAHDCEPTAERALDDNESIRVAVAGHDALLADAVAGRLRDGRAVTGLLVHAARTGEL